MRRWPVAIALALAGAACDAPLAPAPPAAPPAFTHFALTKAENPWLVADLVGTIEGDTVRLELPEVQEVDSVVPSFETTDVLSVVRVGETVQESGASAIDLSHDVRYRITSRGGEAREYVVTITVFTGLPVIYVATDALAEILTKTTYVPATVRVFGGKDHPEWSFTARTQVRGRGNSTWEIPPKKPYKLKLATSASMLGFPADRDWALLANYWDIPLARNATAFAMTAMLPMAYVPRCAPFELVLNGVHQGAYQLCDHMEVAPNRIPAGAGGWFLELNDRRRVDPDEVWFETPEIHEYTTVGHGDTIPSVWVYKQPDPPTAAERAAVEGQLLAFERTLYGAAYTSPDSGYATQLDVQSLIDWYLVMELTKNNDAAFSFGVYIYRPAGGRIAFGPVWDFDLAFGNYPYDGEPTGWKIKPSGWMPRFFSDPAFVAQLKARWQALKARRGDIDAFIVAYTARLQRSQRLSHALWYPYVGRPLLRADDPFAALRAPALPPFPGAFTDADYAAEVQAMRSWLGQRFDWLDANIMAL